MSATVQASRPASLNRRRRVRQKVHAPAYASFRGTSRSEMLNLYEVLDISEVGVSLQCPSPLEMNRQVDLSLDLAEASEQISASARVIWSDSTGRVGLSLPPLTHSAQHHLREWLFLNAMAAAANAAPPADLSSTTTEHSVVRPNYTDTLTAASAVQREAESLGSDLEGLLALVASRTQSLLRASGAAIALAGKDTGTMICRASAGPSAPPLGATLQVGSGFSGECVSTGKMLRCDDAETDARVDRESCRDLGIRSMLAVPIRLRERVVGLLEVFSSEPNAFDENDGSVVQRFAETISAAVDRAVRAHGSPAPAPPKPPSPADGSVLFAREPELKTEKVKPEKVNAESDKRERDEVAKKDASVDADEVGGIRLPRAHLYLLVCVAAFIFLALGYILAPWIQEKLQARYGVHTVLASSRPPQQTTPILAGSAIETATLDQLRQRANLGDPAAENALGLRYASGEGVNRDDKEAAVWFTKAAENGNVKAQVALATRYWAGRGVTPSLSQAYFWAVLARASGDKDSKSFAEILAARLTHAQAAAIEQKAEIWYEQHESQAKPTASR
jgi:putative methionine-R-sulfoxide reductase with GAF domain